MGLLSPRKLAPIAILFALMSHSSTALSCRPNLHRMVQRFAPPERLLLYYFAARGIYEIFQNVFNERIEPRANPTFPGGVCPCCGHRRRGTTSTGTETTASDRPHEERWRELRRDAYNADGTLKSIPENAGDSDSEEE